MKNNDNLSLLSKPEDTIIAVDCGSSHIKVAIARGPRDLLGYSEQPHNALAKGQILDLDALTHCLENALDDVERQSGCSSKKVFVSLAHPQIRYNAAQVTTPVKQQEVSSRDVDCLKNELKKLPIAHGYDVIKDEFCFYSLDGREGIKNPVGMWGNDLVGHYFRVLAPKPELMNAMKIFYGAGLEVLGVYSESLAAAASVLGKDEKDLGVLSVNMGSQLTHVALFTNGYPVFIKDFSFGSNNITKDLSVGLRTSLFEAERVKKEHGSAVWNPRDVSVTLKIASADNKTQRNVTKSDVNAIVEARVKEIFDIIKSDLVSLNLFHKIPRGCVLSGGGSLLPGLTLIAEDIFNCQSRLALPQQAKGIAPELWTPSSSTLAGLLDIAFLNETRNPTNKSGSFLHKSGIAQFIFEKIREPFLRG